MCQSGCMCVCVCVCVRACMWCVCVCACACARAFIWEKYGWRGEMWPAITTTRCVHATLRVAITESKVPQLCLKSFLQHLGCYEKNMWGAPKSISALQWGTTSIQVLMLLLLWSCFYDETGIFQAYTSRICSWLCGGLNHIVFFVDVKCNFLFLVHIFVYPHQSWSCSNTRMLIRVACSWIQNAVASHETWNRIMIGGTEFRMMHEEDLFRLLPMGIAILSRDRNTCVHTQVHRCIHTFTSA